MTNLEPLMEAIRRAVADDADDLTRKAGADACRALLAALDTKPGDPLTDPPPSSPLAAMAAAAEQAPPGVVLDTIIAKLKAMLPEADRDAPASAPLNIPFIKIPGGFGGTGGEK